MVMNIHVASGAPADVGLLRALEGAGIAAIAMNPWRGALDDAEPSQPPYGVERSIWEEALECGEDLADAVADDTDELEGLADRLFGLLRNFV